MVQQQAKLRGLSCEFGEHNPYSPRCIGSQSEGCSAKEQGPREAWSQPCGPGSPDVKDCHREEFVSERNLPKGREHLLVEGPYSPCQVKGEGVYQCGTKRLRKNRKEGIIAAEAKIMVFCQKEDKSVRGLFSTGSDESKG